MSLENHTHQEPPNGRVAKVGFTGWLRLRILVAMLTLAVIATFAIVIGVYLNPTAHKPPIVRVTVHYPGMPMEAMEGDLTSRIARWCRDDADVRQITTISTKGRADIFVKGYPGADPQKLLKSVRTIIMPDLIYLPPGTQPIAVLLYDDETIPKVQIRQVDKQEIEFDRDRLALYGISPAKLNVAVLKATNTHDKLHPDMQLTIGAGKGDAALFRIFDRRRVV